MHVDGHEDRYEQQFAIRMEAREIPPPVALVEGSQVAHGTGPLGVLRAHETDALGLRLLEVALGIEPTQPERDVGVHAGDVLLRP